MDETVQTWFEETLARAQAAAERARAERGSKSALASGVVDDTEPVEWEFKGVSLILVPGLNLCCRILGAARDPAGCRHMFFGRMWLDALGPSGESLGGGVGLMRPSVIAERSKESVKPIWEEALRNLEEKLGQSQAFTAVMQAAEIARAAKMANGGTAPRGARL